MHPALPRVRRTARARARMTWLFPRPARVSLRIALALERRALLVRRRGPDRVPRAVPARARRLLRAAAARERGRGEQGQGEDCGERAHRYLRSGAAPSYRRKRDRAVPIADCRGAGAYLSRARALLALSLGALVRRDDAVRREDRA